MENTSLAGNPLLDLTQPPRFGAILPEHAAPALDHVLAENRAADRGYAGATEPHVVAGLTPACGYGQRTVARRLQCRPAEAHRLFHGTGAGRAALRRL